MPFLARSRFRPAILLAAAAVALVSVVAVSGRAGAANNTSVATTAKAALLMDADTGAILFQHNADELLPPASITKLMTIEMVFQAIKAGRLKLDDQLNMSVHAWKTGGAPSRTSSMFVPVNNTASVDELLQGMIVQSANDAAIAIAEGMAGSEEAFAKRMMIEARRIGLTKSVFKNPSGLYDPEHVMTAREIGMLALYIIKEHADQYSRFGQKEFQYHKYKFRNRNPLLFEDIGVDGMKTGSLKEAGYNLVASSMQNGKRLIAVVMGLPSDQQSAAEAKRLLQWGFSGFAPFKLFEAGETVGKARVWGGDSFYVPLTGAGPVTIVLPRVPANPRLQAVITYEGPLKPPIKKGDQVARLRVTSQTNTVNEVPLYAAQDVGPGGLMRRGLDSLAHLAFSWVAL
jgi:serine-type D-Ala-D-Ala carboxypeptidase (penicillin-binding protein 5/6)